jgi:MoxR-like ATPase
MNPVDRIGTNPLPGALYDRCAWIRIPHLDLEGATRVVMMRTDNKDRDFVRAICRVVELARTHPEVSSGASVRAAIHITRLLMNLPAGRDPFDPAEVLRCAEASLARNIRMKYDAVTSPSEIVAAAVEEVFGPKKG